MSPEVEGQVLALENQAQVATLQQDMGPVIAADMAIERCTEEFLCDSLNHRSSQIQRADSVSVLQGPKSSSFLYFLTTWIMFAFFKNYVVGILLNFDLSR